MIVLPRAETDHTVDALRRLPGIDGTAARRALLLLAWPTEGNGDLIPDVAIESGWSSIVDHLAQPPAHQAIANLQRLLRGIGQALQLGELTELFDEASGRLAQLIGERSLPVFLARLGIDIDDETNSIALTNTVFVPPKQYKKAAEILEREHMLFLFGDPHMGKTFSALHFLWEHFRDRGREPYWWRTPLSSGAAETDLDSLIINGASIYVEDPFGRTAPIDNADDMLRNLRRLLFNAKNHDVRIIVTSRTAVLRATAFSFETYLCVLAVDWAGVT